MTCYMIRLRYDGTDFCGYQPQANGRTVGGELLGALRRTFGSVTSLAGCSRTDSGVHALDYRASFRSEKRLEPQTAVRALNAWLPDDIVVFGCQYVSEDFHARYSVTEKEYMYRIRNSSLRDPFTDRYTLLYPGVIDLQRLNRAAECIEGRHDFTSFTNSGASVRDHVREVKHAYFTRQEDEIRFYISADGFLYNMVRIITGTLLDMASGLIPYEAMPDIIAACDRSVAGRTAPARGLFLNRVVY